MISLIVPFIGSLVGAGIFISWQGLVGGFSPRQSAVKAQRRKIFDLRLGVALVAAVVVGLISKVPVAGLLAGAAGWTLVGLIMLQRQQQQTILVTEALATWTDLLRDVVSGSAGVGAAIQASAKNPPANIRSEVKSLAEDLRGDIPPKAALNTFASTLADPVADQVVIALQMALEVRGDRLSEVLSATAANAREDVTFRRTTIASQSQLWRQVYTIAGVMVGMFALLFVFQSSYLDAFSDLVGQLVLLFIGLIWAVSIKMMISLADIAKSDRVLDTSSSTKAGF